MEFSDSIRSVSSVVKFFEAFVIVILLSWSTTRLPFVVKHSVDYLTEFSLFLSSTPSVFLIGNVIIIALVAKLPSLDAKAVASEDEDADLYDEFVGDIRRKISGAHETLINNDGKGEENNHIVCTVRQVTNGSSITPFTSNCPVGPAQNQVEEKVSNPVRPEGNGPVGVVCEERATYRRSRSETFSGKNDVDLLKLERRKELRRTATVYGGIERERVVEELSNDEFRRTIEEFIAKQKSILREENLAIVSSNRNAV